MDSLEKLTIDTPEQVELQFPLSGIGSRFLALFYDTLIQLVAYLSLLLVSLLIAPDPSRWMAAVNKWITALLILAFFVLYWGYYAFFEAIWKGQTPGKRRAQIRVIKENGRPINTFEAIARNLMRVVDQLPGIYAVGVIVMLLNRRQRRLGDFVAGTVVVHETREVHEPEIVWSLPADVAPLDASGFSARELEIIEAFLARRIDLPAEVRQATAQKMADLFAARLNLSPEARGSNEDLLERLAVQIRNAQRYRPTGK